jgi:hypothetical protein
METINNSKYRIGNFTSSEIYHLMTTNRKGNDFGAPALTYIEETNFKRLLGRSLNTDMNSKPTSWGNLVEGLVFEKLGLDFTYSSQVTDMHPTIDYWAGSKDGTRECKNRAVIDIKCPFTMKSFVQLVKPIYDGLTGIEAMNAIRESSKDGEKYYWQLVSNAIINGCDFAELIVYCPYKSELPEIYALAEGNPDVKWLSYSSDSELPYLINGGYFQNLNIISFEVSQADKDALTAAVLKAGTMLVPRIELKQAA